MKIIIYISLFCINQCLMAQSIDASTKKYVDSLTSVLIDSITVLNSRYSTLQNGLQNQNTLVSGFVASQRLNVDEKWNMISSNLKASGKIVETLNNKIIQLKSRFADAEYQNFLLSLSSVDQSPLGFSFSDVIMKSAKKNVVFRKESKMNRFLTSSQSIINSPIINNIPGISSAVSIANSVLGIANSAAIENDEIDSEKVEKFQSELNNYISYYVALDNANRTNSQSNLDRISILTSLQLELVARLQIDGPLLGIPIRSRLPDEDIDDFIREVISDYSEAAISSNLSSQLNTRTSPILVRDQSLLKVNNRLQGLMELGYKFIDNYDKYFETEDRYAEEISKALDLANSNKIIQQVGNKLPEEVYQDLKDNLVEKKSIRDRLFKNSINIDELERLLDSILPIKFISA